MEQNTYAKMPKYKHDKIQKNKIQIAKIQMQQKTNATKYKWDKIQIEQNAKILKYKNSKIQILGVLIENQRYKGGGLLYGGLYFGI